MYAAAPLPAMSRVKAHVAERPVVRGGIVEMAPDIGSHLHGVRAAQNAEVIDKLICAAVVEIRGCLAISHAQEAFDVENGKPLLIRPQRTAVGTPDFEPHDAELLDSKVGVLPDAELLDIALVPAKAEFIQQRRAERVHVLRRQVLIRKRGVVEEVGIQLRVRKFPC